MILRLLPVGVLFVGYASGLIAERDTALATAGMFIGGAVVGFLFFHLKKEEPNGQP